MQTIAIPAIGALILPLEEALRQVARRAYFLNKPAVVPAGSLDAFFAPDPHAPLCEAQARVRADTEGMALVRALHELHCALNPEDAIAPDEDAVRRRWQWAIEGAEVDESHRRARARGDDMAPA